MFRVARGSGLTEIIVARGRNAFIRNSESRLDRSKQAKPRVPLRLADQCQPIVSTSYSRHDPSLSSAPLRAEHRRAVPSSPIFIAPVLPARSISSIPGTMRSREFVRSNPMMICLSAPDLAVIAAPPPTVPSVVAAAAAKGTAAAIIITAGLGHGPGSLAELCVKNARAAGMRLVGPNCLGVLVPGVKLNASFAASIAAAGRPRADFAIRRAGYRIGGVGVGPRHRIFRHRLHRRQHRRRFRRCCSTSSPWIAGPAPFFCTSNRSRTPASSCRRRVPRRAPSRRW